ncbi:hypothetical protein Nmel_010262, partial [Mimus melanotis]
SSNCFQPFCTGTNRSKRVQTGLHQPKPVQAISYWFTLLQTGLNQSKLLQTGSNQSKPVNPISNQFKPV